MFFTNYTANATTMNIGSRFAPIKSAQYSLTAFLLFLFWTPSTGKLGADRTISLCGDSSWSLINDEKCIKLFDSHRLVNFAEASNYCSLVSNGSEFLDQSPLISIKSTQEQAAVSEFLYEKLNVTDDVWLGAQRAKMGRFGLPSHFQWEEGKPLEFSNWAGGRPSNDLQRNCTQLISSFSRSNSNSPAKLQKEPSGNGQRSTALIRSEGHGTQKPVTMTVSNEGLWTDTSCSKRNLALCQKPAHWTSSQIVGSILALREDLNTLNRLRLLEQSKNSEQLQKLQDGYSSLQTRVKELDQNPVPIGFVYVQLPNRSGPEVMWPKVNWTDVSSKYAGLFFRVFGEDSEDFGAIQEESCPRISRAQYKDRNSEFVSNITLSSEWSEWITSDKHSDDRSGHGHFHSMRFYTTRDEVRPRNTAVRIWQRSA